MVIPDARKTSATGLAPHPLSPQIVLFVASLLCVTAIFLPFDVVHCWLPWGIASGGTEPWRIYATRPDCNYPPVMLYLLTLGDGMRRGFGLPDYHANSLYFVKVPQIMAHIAGGLAGYSLLRPRFGEAYARWFALMYAASLPLFVNAALWGQADALLSLFILLSVACLMVEKPVWAGAWIGVALGVKVQAVILAPVLLLYVWRKFGVKTLGVACVAALAALAALCLPFVIAGTGKELAHTYFGAAGYYHDRVLNAFNLWGLLDYIAVIGYKIPHEAVSRDDVSAFGFVTYRHIGLTLFGGVLAAILACLYKTPNPRTLVWASALSCLAFFTLCTQMHERYGVPGAVLLTLIAPEGGIALAVWGVANVTHGWNQWVILLGNWVMSHKLSPILQRQMELWVPSLLWVSLVNIALLAVGIAALFRVTATNKDSV